MVSIVEISLIYIGVLAIKIFFQYKHDPLELRSYCYYVEGPFEEPKLQPKHQLKTGGHMEGYVVFYIKDDVTP